MSTHRVEVVPVVLEKHPDADALSIVRVRGFQVVVRTADWLGRDRGAYLEPDSLVPEDRPEVFGFLRERAAKLGGLSGDRWRRIKVARLRGALSQGLLVPAPEGAAIGDDVAALLGVTRYDPPIQMGPGFTGGEAGPAPPGWRPVYDLENFNRYPTLFAPGEPVVVTEKIHGASARYAAAGGELFAGSRTEWKREDERNLWWRALRTCPALEAFVRANEGLTVYAEVYGQVQDLRYGASRDRPVMFAAFDLWDVAAGAWLPWDAARAALDAAGVPLVPEIYRGPFDDATIRALAEGPSMVPGADNVREGVVVKPLAERQAAEIGRAALKLVSDSYLERA